MPESVTPDEKPDEKPDETPEVKPDEKPEDKPDEKPDDKPDESVEGENLDELPEWARKRLTKANSEAANYRTQLRDVQAKLEGAKTPEEFAAATAELAEANTALEVSLAKERALRVHGLEETDLIFLTASKAEDIEAQAKALAARLPAVREPDPKELKGGLDPSDDDTEPNDPRALAAKYGRRRY